MSPSLIGLRIQPVYGSRSPAFKQPAGVMVETPSPAVFAKEVLVSVPASFYFQPNEREKATFSH
jgi:hypothetical protein